MKAVSADQAGGGRWVRRPDVLWRWVLDGVALLPPSADDPFVITGAGAALWELLEEPCSTDELVAELAALYQTDAPTVSAAVRPLLAELADRGGLQRVR
jgi:hypothetical protein